MFRFEYLVIRTLYGSFFTYSHKVIAFTLDYTSKDILATLSRIGDILMNKIHLSVLLFSLLQFHTTLAKAQELYSVEYAPDSPIQSIPLENTEIKLKIYEYEKPHGFIRVVTNKNREFSLERSYDLEVEAIEGEATHNADCSGHATVHNRQIKLTCVPRGN